MHRLQIITSLLADRLVNSLMCT